jgi:hypothetical protein
VGIAELSHYNVISPPEIGKILIFCTGRNRIEHDFNFSEKPRCHSKEDRRHFPKKDRCHSEPPQSGGEEPAFLPSENLGPKTARLKKRARLVFRARFQEANPKRQNLKIRKNDQPKNDRTINQ